MCDCHRKKKKRPVDAAEPSFSKASISESVNPALAERVPINLASHVPSEPFNVDVFMDDGKKKTISLSHKLEIPRQLKLKIMQRAPGFFSTDDPDWQYIGGSFVVANLFQKASANV